jgi:hypothetical protein
MPLEKIFSRKGAKAQRKNNMRNRKTSCLSASKAGTQLVIAEHPPLPLGESEARGPGQGEGLIHKYINPCVDWPACPLQTVGSREAAVERTGMYW